MIPGGALEVVSAGDIVLFGCVEGMDRRKTTRWEVPIEKFRDNTLVLASELGKMVASEALAVAARCCC